MGRFLKISTAVVAAAAVAAGGVALWIHGEITGPGPSTDEVRIVIERGVGIDGIARTLAAAGVVASPTVFSTLRR